MSNLTNSRFNKSLLNMSALTTNAQSQDIANTFARGFVGYLNVSSLGAGAPTAIIALMAKDPASGLYTQLAVTTAITLVVGLNAFAFYPGLNGTNPLINCVAPADFALKVTAGGTGSITGGVTGCLIV